MKTNISEEEARKRTTEERLRRKMKRSPILLYRIRRLYNVCRLPRLLSKNDISRLIDFELKLLPETKRRLAMIFDVPIEAEYSSEDSDDTISDD